jgi:catechol 2,3-dioxygenase-like lactoylglutathione lyase family enzyme
MTGFKILGFNHTSVTVSDLDRTIRAFVEACGFELMTRGPRDPKLLERMTAIPGADVEIAFVKGPGHRLERIQLKGPPGRAVIQSRLFDTGAARTGLDVDDIEAAVGVARDHGFELVGEIITIDSGLNAGRPVAYTRDPDGVTVEYLQAPAGGAQ